jgi:hypothetical protein
MLSALAIRRVAQSSSAIFMMSFQEIKKWILNVETKRLRERSKVGNNNNDSDLVTHISIPLHSFIQTYRLMASAEQIFP